MNKVITIKVYETSRDRIKENSAKMQKKTKVKTTMQDYVEELSKIDLSKKE